VVEADFAYLAMEYVKGFSLEEHYAHRQAAAHAPRDRHHLQVLHGARRAYRQGIIHRDIKPANIMVAADDEPRSPISAWRST
jgi:serine/threonine protein kinase